MIYYLTEIGLYYLQSRYYDANIGRFINSDCIIDSGNSTLFAYCASDPTNRCDVTGRSWVKVKNFISRAVRSIDSFLIKCGVNTTVVGANLLDMEKNGNTYHAKFDCWQQYFGYNDFYDFAFGTI